MARKVGRPLSSDWKETAIAAAELGLTAPQLLALRLDVFTAGKHYRVKNPQAALNGRRYLWHVQRCEPLLTPQGEADDRGD
jgi:hypothetical protein